MQKFTIVFKNEQGNYEQVGTNNRMTVWLKTGKGAINRAKKARPNTDFLVLDFKDREIFEYDKNSIYY